MRPFGLALLVLALTAAPASAAVVSVDEYFCRCDPSSGDESTLGISVAAHLGERNRVTVRKLARGVLIRDDGAPLTGECRTANDGGGRFCRGVVDYVSVSLEDGDDTLDADVGGAVDAGPGDDRVRTTGFFSLLSGGPGADLLDARGARSAAVDYVDHSAGVTVRLNGIADDGADGEGDNVRGPVTHMTGGAGNDRLEAGPSGSLLLGAGGNDVLVGSPERDSLDGEEGDDTLTGREGNDYLTGGGGADDLGGGAGADGAIYTSKAEPLRLSIGDGADDGAPGEGDDIHGDIEGLAGGAGNDVLIGSAGANRLIGHGGQDVLRGGAGPDALLGSDDGDELHGWGDELDAGPGPDRVHAGALDRPLLRDGEADHLNCRRHAPAIEADRLDTLISCAPPMQVRRRSRLRSGRVVTLVASCPADSAVRCRGRLWLVAFRDRRITPKLPFGPLEPGERLRLRTRLPVPMRSRTCIRAVTHTRREGGLESVTVSSEAVGCLAR
jgi:RTX calcium-binding nonapeptide repeat (4 copies)